MASPHLAPVYDDFLEFLVKKASPSEILAFKVSEEAQQRAAELLERQDAGLLSPEEADELEQMLQFDRLVSMLKAKALKASTRS
jgi:hypothetical protein